MDILCCFFSDFIFFDLGVSAHPSRRPLPCHFFTNFYSFRAIVSYGSFFLPRARRRAFRSNFAPFSLASNSLHNPNFQIPQSHSNPQVGAHNRFNPLRAPRTIYRQGGGSTLHLPLHVFVAPPYNSIVLRKKCKSRTITINLNLLSIN